MSANELMMYGQIKFDLSQEDSRDFADHFLPKIESGESIYVKDVFAWIVREGKGDRI